MNRDMDHRKALPPGTLLPFPAMPCTVAEESGRGSNAMVYIGSYPDLLNPEERHTVLIKELFPLHQKNAIFRDESGAVVCTPEGREAWELHLQSFQNGNRVHLRMLEKHPDLIGSNLNTFSLQGTLYTVLGYTKGRSLEAESSVPETDLRRLTVRMLGLLDALDTFHESGFLHLDVAPDNILLTGRGSREQVLLIDYNSVYDRKAPAALPYRSIKAGFSAPEIRTGGDPSAASDLFSVAAVFYRCLSGAALTPFQMSRPGPPDISALPCLKSVPDTVCVMVRQILQKGLQVLPKKRYQSTAAMRDAFQELLDRIDGVGVTHWALWESGRKIVARVIWENPGLAFLQDTESLFPARFRTPDGTVLPAGIPALLKEQGRAVLLTASGGMGKTTAMLRSVAEQSRSYCATRPAMVYLSLYGWKEGEPAYIRRRLLENLRFKTEQYDAARYALDTLLEKPLVTRSGEQVPVLLLLLDGLNEAAGETAPLLEEIRTLSHMPGVRLLISARNEEPALPFPRVELAPLTPEDVGTVLARAGLLLPESAEMQTLLQTPLMLSIFLQSARAEGRQLTAGTQEELLRAYFQALLEKESKQLPDDTDTLWQIEAAMFFVLPAIAREIQKKRRALGDTELLPAVERCYRLFSDRLLRRAFPRWIGHSKAIRGGAANAEEWYGRIVHQLLWKRLGLLVRNEQGRYRICHETVAEYLMALESNNARKLLRRRRLRRSLAALLLLLILTMGHLGYITYIQPPAYRDTYEDFVFFHGLSGYANAARQYKTMHSLLVCAAETPEKYRTEKKSFDYTIDRIGTATDPAFFIDNMETMLATGKVFSWSRKQLDAPHYKDMMYLESDRREEYKLLADVLTYVLEDPRGHRLYGDTYPALLTDLVEIDADITATLYELVCVPHLTQELLADDANSQNMLSSLLADAIDQNEHLSGETDLNILNQRLLTLQGRRTTTMNNLRISGVIASYLQTQKEDSP